MTINRREIESRFQMTFLVDLLAVCYTKHPAKKLIIMAL